MHMYVIDNGKSWGWKGNLFHGHGLKNGTWVVGWIQWLMS